MTIDETWNHHYTIELKQQAKQWVEPGGTTPKRANTQQTVEKIITSIFWDSSRILFIDYLETETHQQQLLLCIIGLIERRNHKKTTSFVKEKNVSFFKTMHQPTNR